MINPSFYKIFGNIEYERTKEILKDVQKKIEKINLELFCALSGLSIYRHSLSTAYALAGITISLIYVSNEIYRQNMQIYSKEFLEIKTLYDEITKDFHKMCETFGFKEPVEIHALFEQSLRRGYFSKTKEYEYENISSEFENIMGAYTFTGKSACKHIATLEKDIMQQCGMKSSTLNVYQETMQPLKNEYKSNNQVSTKKKEIMEETTDGLLDLEEIKALLRKYGNYLITMVVKDGKVNFFDAPQGRIYKLSKNIPLLLLDFFPGDTEITTQESSFIGTKKEYKNMKKYLHLNSTALSEDYALYTNTSYIVFNNRDILEKFYKENKSKYIEIDNKIKELEKKR